MTLGVFPDPDTPTMERLMGIAQMHGSERASETSAEMLSSIVAFLIGGVGPEKTAEIMRDWAGAVQRRCIGVTRT